MPPLRVPRRWFLAAAVLLALAAAALAIAPTIARRALIAAAAKRGLAAGFAEASLHWGPALRVRGLTLTRTADGDTVLVADALELRVAPLSLLTLHPRPSAVRLDHARAVSRAARGANPDTLSPEETASPRKSRRDRRDRLDHSGRVRDAARAFVRTLLLPARSLPSLSVNDLVVTRATPGETDRAIRIARLSLVPERGGARLTATGTLELEQPVPFSGEIAYARDDRLSGHWDFRVPGPRGNATWPLSVGIEGRVHQDRAAGRIEFLEPTRVRIGDIAIALSGRIEREGPAFRLAIAADSLSGERLRRSLPPPTLGPLTGLATRGRWDYRASLDLDLARPDSVQFGADVIPHGLALDPARSRLDLTALDQPFVAEIHLPRNRVVTRDLSPENPHFLRLDEIDPRLAAAVVTNEDGGFFRHHGFNTEAVKAAIAENIRAGAFRRGAGTITMQIARNLWLGHARTLSRKAQEVILAWVLEHLTGIGKDRLLEIYLNIIEWGPGVHGADEAARYYFGHGARHVSVDEALFLAILVPSPSKWKWRLDDQGELRPFAREQMHFIGRAMIAKGWLDADDLPPVDDLRIELRGPARSEFFPDSGEQGPSARREGIRNAGPRRGANVSIATHAGRAL